MSLIEELPVPEQIALWDRRASDADMQSTEPDSTLEALLADEPGKLRQGLDIGCGCGRHLLLGHTFSWRMTGYDWSQEALKFAARNVSQAEGVAQFIKGDFRRLPFSASQFSLIIATNVLQHGRLADFRRAVLEIKRVMKIGGMAVISLPGRANAPQPWTGNWIEDGTVIIDTGKEAGIPHHFFSEEEIERSCAQFREIGIQTTVEPLPPGHEPLHAHWLNEWHWVLLRG
jgi:SAM-dependent methyltransferase